MLTHAEMFTLRRSYGNDPEATVDPECTAIVGRTPPAFVEFRLHYVCTILYVDIGLNQLLENVCLHTQHNRVRRFPRILSATS